MLQVLDLLAGSQIIEITNIRYFPPVGVHGIGMIITSPGVFAILHFSQSSFPNIQLLGVALQTWNNRVIIMPCFTHAETDVSRDVGWFVFRQPRGLLLKCSVLVTEAHVSHQG